MFIKVTDEGGRSVLLNFDYVIAIRYEDDGNGVGLETENETFYSTLSLKELEIQLKRGRNIYVRSI